MPLCLLTYQGYRISFPVFVIANLLFVAVRLIKLTVHHILNVGLR